MVLRHAWVGGRINPGSSGPLSEYHEIHAPIQHGAGEASPGPATVLSTWDISLRCHWESHGLVCALSSDTSNHTSPQKQAEKATVYGWSPFPHYWSIDISVLFLQMVLASKQAAMEKREVIGFTS